MPSVGAATFKTLAHPTLPTVDDLADQVESRTAADWPVRGYVSGRRRFDRSDAVGLVVDPRYYKVG